MKSVYFLIVFILFQPMSFSFEQLDIENRVINEDFDKVFFASVELLIKHSWQFAIVDKMSGFIQTKSYHFEFQNKPYDLYVRIFLRPVSREKTAIHISWQSENLYRNALGLPLKISKDALSIEQKINQYFKDLLNILRSY